MCPLGGLLVLWPTCQIQSMVFVTFDIVGLFMINISWQSCQYFDIFRDSQTCGSLCALYVLHNRTYHSPVNSPHKGQWRGALMLMQTIVRLVIWDTIAPIMTSLWWWNAAQLPPHPLISMVEPCICRGVTLEQNTPSHQQTPCQPDQMSYITHNIHLLCINFKKRNLFYRTYRHLQVTVCEGTPPIHRGFPSQRTNTAVSVSFSCRPHAYWESCARFSATPKPEPMLT